MNIRPIKTENDYRWAPAEIAPYFDFVPEKGSADADWHFRHLGIMTLLKFLFAFFLLAVFPVHAEEPRSIAVFDFELVDTSLEGEMRGPDEAESARIGLISAQLRGRLEASDRYTVIDLGPMAERAAAKNLQACGGCDVQMARALGADLAVTGTVRKISTLILSINLYVRDAGTGEIVEGASADIRGNTDESWQRGVRWLLKNRVLLKDETAEK